MGREIVVKPPADWAGRAACADLVGRLEGLGVWARIERRPEGIGPADALAGSWAERAAVLQFEQGMDRQDVEAAAWEGCTVPAAAPQR